ncbi:MAG: class I SAM-dependent methyltransferase [Acidimicrobiia bacterium]
MTSGPNLVARRLFAPIASSYERWAAVLSLGQDSRWRRRMVDGLSNTPEAAVLDVAAGTGSITRLLQARGWVVTAVDLSREMLSLHPGPARVLARAEQLPFADASFDALTFGYLLRYVDDPVGCLVELGRVVKSGGQIGMVEFGLPRGIWNPWWRLYSGTLLPQAGRLVGPGWRDVGSFLKGSIEDFYLAHPEPERLFKLAGFTEVRIEKLSLGGGVVAWGRKP